LGVSKECLERFSRAERAAIELHRAALAKKAGREVALDAAIEDWIKHHAADYLQQSQARMLEMQRKEIARHRWIESEKAGRDVGREAALDWVLKYAAMWRDWYDREVEGKEARQRS